MAHASFKILPGVDQNKTPALNEAAVSTSQLIRFMPDRTLGGIVQKLGGWSKYITAQIGSYVRALWAWEDTNANSYLAVGAEGLAPIVVTGASGNGSTVTLIYTGPQTFKVNYGITVTGMNPSAYNGNYIVTASTSTSVSFASTTTSSFVSGGLIYGAGGTLNVITNNIVTDITPQTLTNNVAVNFSTFGPQTITGASGTGTTATLTFAGPETIPVGYTIIVSGVTPTAYNGTYIVTASSSTSVSYSSTSNAAFVSGGTVSTNQILVTITGAKIDSYDTIDIQTQISVGGLILFGMYQCYSNDANSFFIYAKDILGSPAPATSTVSNGGSLATYTTTAVGGAFVTVVLNNHGYGVGDTYTALVATSVGGVVIYGNYTVVKYIDVNTFQITATTGATSIATVTQNGGQLHYVLYNSIGPIGASVGYGAGGYGAGGYGIGSSVTSSQNAATPINAVDWTLDNWGQLLIASPYNGAIYEWDPSAGNITANVIPNAPQYNHGAFVAMPQRQIVAWGSTYNGIIDPLLIRWSDVGDYNSWTASIINQAGSYRIPKGSRIVQGIQGPQQGLLWTDLGLWAMQYVGPPYVYQFNELGNGCGLIGRKAAGSVNGIIYWMGQSQFFKYGSNGVEPIRCPIWDVIFQDLDTNNLDKIRIAPNSRFGEISWHYPTKESNGEVYAYIKYNFLLDVWDFGSNSAANPYVSRTAWINESVLGPPIGAGTDTYIYQHETSYNADTQAMDSYFQTGYFVLHEADVKMFVDQIWPDMKWGYYNQTQGANVLLTFYVNDYAGQTPTAYGPFTMTQATQFITPRFRGRLVSIKIESTDYGSFWRLGNIRYRVQEDGKY